MLFQCNNYSPRNCGRQNHRDQLLAFLTAPMIAQLLATVSSQAIRPEKCAVVVFRVSPLLCPLGWWQEVESVFSQQPEGLLVMSLKSGESDGSYDHHEKSKHRRDSVLFSFLRCFCCPSHCSTLWLLITIAVVVVVRSEIVAAAEARRVTVFDVLPMLPCCWSGTSCRSPIGKSIHFFILSRERVKSFFSHSKKHPKNEKSQVKLFVCNSAQVRVFVFSFSFFGRSFSITLEKNNHK